VIVELWADGSGGVTGEPGGWAYVLRAERNGEWVESVDSGGASATTNNRMEIMAVLMGLRALKRPCTVDLYSDSEYVVKAIAKGWIAGWKAKGWPKRIKNPDLWIVLDELLAVHHVRAHWVRGHAGTPLNERCDELAGAMRKAAAASREFVPEPAGDASAVQLLLDPDSEAHLQAIAGGA
jgi:ribonuclease HI